MFGRKEYDRIWLIVGSNDFGILLQCSRGGSKMVVLEKLLNDFFTFSKNDNVAEEN